MLCCKRVWGLLGCVLVVGLGVCALARVPVWGQDGASQKAGKLQTLLEERRDALKDRLDMYEHLVKIARSSPEEVVAARHDYLDAELAVAANKTARLDVLQRKLANAKELEAIMKARKVAAKGTECDVMLAKARRLDVEIAILHEQES